MILGFDIHGVLDHHPEKFIKIAKENKAAGYFVNDGDAGFKNYVITGPTRSKALAELHVLAEKYNNGIPFWDEVYSIVDCIKTLDIPHTVDEKGHVWALHADDWNKIKGILAKQLKLEMHWDDSIEYEPYFEPGVFCYVKRRK